MRCKPTFAILGAGNGGVLLLPTSRPEGLTKVNNVWNWMNMKTGKYNLC